MTQTTHDFSRKGAVTVLTVQDKGARIRVVAWNYVRVAEEDFLLLPNGDETTRYRVEPVYRPGDPSDQWFAWLTFAPRQLEDAAS